VALLQVDPFTQTYQDVQHLRPLDGIPFNPSALDVLQSATGLTVLVTDEGLDQLFAYTLPVAVGPETPSGLAVPFQAGANISLPPLVAPEPVPLTTPPSTAPLLLVVTLSPGLLPGAGTEAAVEAPEVAVLLTLLVESGSAEAEETAPPPELQPHESNSGPGFKELLRRLEVAPKTEEGVPGHELEEIPGPFDLPPKKKEQPPNDSMFEKRPWDLPALSAPVLTAFWQRVGEGRLPAPAAGACLQERDQLTRCPASRHEPEKVAWSHSATDAVFASWSEAPRIADAADSGKSADAATAARPTCLGVGGVPRFVPHPTWNAALLTALAIGGVASRGERLNRRKPRRGGRHPAAGEACRPSRGLRWW
jgi:hypothetical protein